MSKGEQTQKDVLQYLQTYIEDNGWAPSIRDIADGVGKSPNASWLAVQALKDQGLIEVGPNPRQIRMVRMKAATEQL